MNKYLAAAFLLLVLGCKKTDSTNNNSSNASADINSVHWTTHSITVVRNTATNTISALIGKFGNNTIELDVPTYPTTFATGIYTFRPAGVDSVVFASFTGKINSSAGTELDWSAISDTALSSFDIERSTDGTNFAVLGNVTAVNNAGIQNYVFVDAAPIQGANYYRLKAVAKNGTYIYTHIIAVRYSSALPITALYNNVDGYNGTIRVIGNDTVNHIITVSFSFDYMYQSQLIQIRNGFFTVHY